jgi:hypothetical protein
LFFKKGGRGKGNIPSETPESLLRRIIDLIKVMDMINIRPWVLQQNTARIGPESAKVLQIRIVIGVGDKGDMWQWTWL